MPSRRFLQKVRRGTKTKRLREQPDRHLCAPHRAAAGHEVEVQEAHGYRTHTLRETIQPVEHHQLPASVDSPQPIGKGANAGLHFGCRVRGSTAVPC
jgi:hypothetical protein